MPGIVVRYPLLERERKDSRAHERVRERPALSPSASA